MWQELTQRSITPDLDASALRQPIARAAELPDVASHTFEIRHRFNGTI
jgi:hypothetical protein